MIIRKFQKCSMIMSISFLVFIISGCTSLFESDTPVIEQSEKPTEITLTPVDLFEGDAAKFKLFLGSMSGAFKLRYEGNKPTVKLDIDIWRNGKKVSSSGSIGDLFFGSKESHEVEVIISVDTTSIKGTGEFFEVKVNAINDSGSSLTTFTFPWDKKLTTQGLIDNTEPFTFNTDESVHVWGMQATSNNVMRVADFSPESLSGLEWALIFTLNFEDELATNKEIAEINVGKTPNGISIMP